jgi:PPOX class probable F420-dependent enzyme
MAVLSDKATRLFSEPNIVHLATIMEDGSPQVSPIWADITDGVIEFNTAAGRVKERNMRRDPRIALSVADRNDPYERATVRGRVVEMIEGPEARAHIDKMAKKYLGTDEYPWYKGETRIIVRVEPERSSD